jgi:hypothetical protein
MKCRTGNIFLSLNNFTATEEAQKFKTETFAQLIFKSNILKLKNN